MRKIRFRGKRKDTCEWVFGDFEYNHSKNIARIHTYDEDGNYERQHEVNPETVGQFTGLFDRNGKEIYEGDIIKGKLMAWHTIRYNEENAAFVASFFDSPNNCCTVTQSWINEFNKTVIGNIHDNIELLKGDEK